jgi:hypothetical protein
MTPSEVRAATHELVRLQGRFASLFGRKEACAQSLVYLRGLLGAEGRRSAEPMALVFGHPPRAKSGSFRSWPCNASALTGPGKRRTFTARSRPSSPKNWSPRPPAG